MTAPDARLVETFLDLARLEGTSGRERAVADRVLARLREAGLRPEEGEPPAGGDAGCVVCRVGAGVTDRILLAHLDTARSTRGLVVRRLPDRITSDGRTVLGVDDRLGVAIVLEAAVRAAHGEIDARPFVIGFTVSEETTLAGAQALRWPEGVRFGFAFDSSRRPGAYVASSFGAMRWRVTVTGRAAHSGIAPEKGIDAIRVLSRAIARLPLGRIDGTATANVGFVGGGSAVNVVPSDARAEGEIRATTIDRVESLASSFRAFFEREAADAGAAVRFDTDWDFLPYTLDPGAPARVEAERALRAAGLEPDPVTSPGGSDVNVLNARGLPCVNLGIGAQNPHGDDEFVLLQDLADAFRVAGTLVRGS